MQVPFEVPIGNGSVEVRTGLGTASSSFAVGAVSPGIFTIGGNQGAILTSDNELAAPSGSISGRSARPARRGEFISIYATGLGDVTNRPASGAGGPPPPTVAETVLRPTVSIGGVPLNPSFSGLAPDFVGLYQLNVQLPMDIAAGNAVPVMLQIGGVNSNTVTLAVQ